MKQIERRYDLKCKEVAELLGGILTSTVRSWALKGLIPHRRYSEKTIRFCKDEVMDWAEEHKIEKKIASL